MMYFTTKTERLAIQAISIFLSVLGRQSIKQNSRLQFLLGVFLLAGLIFTSGCSLTANSQQTSEIESKDILEQSQKVNQPATTLNIDGGKTLKTEANYLERPDKSADVASENSTDWNHIYTEALNRPTGRTESELKLIRIIPDTPFALSITADGEVRLWDIPGNQSYYLCEISNNFQAVALNISRGLIAAAYTGRLDLYSIESCMRLAILDRVKTRFASVQFDPAGRSMIAAGMDSKVYRWRFAHQLESRSLRDRQLSLERYFGHAASTSSLAVHPGGRVFFSGDTAGVIHAWLAYNADQFQGRYDQSEFGFKGHSKAALRGKGRLAVPDRIESIESSDDGNRILLAAQDGRVEVWKVRGFVREAAVVAHTGLIYDTAIVPGTGGTLFFTIGRDSFVRLWRLEENKELRIIKIVKRKEFSVPDGHLIAGLSETSLLVGVRGGRILEVQFKNNP